VRLRSTLMVFDQARKLGNTSALVCCRSAETTRSLRRLMQKRLASCRLPKPSYRNGKETFAEPDGGATVVQNDAHGKGRSGRIPQFAESAEIGVADRRGGSHFHTGDGVPLAQYQIHLVAVVIRSPDLSPDRRL
jgi:hypothetical protein